MEILIAASIMFGWQREKNVGNRPPALPAQCPGSVAQSGYAREEYFCRADPDRCTPALLPSPAFGSCRGKCKKLFHAPGVTLLC